MSCSLTRIVLLACLLAQGAAAAPSACVDSFGRISYSTHACPALRPLDVVHHASPAAIRNIVAHLTPVQVHALVSPMSADEIAAVLRQASQAQIGVAVNQASHGQVRAVASALKSGTLLSVLNALGVGGLADLTAKVWPVIPIGLLSEEKQARISDKLSKWSPSDFANMASKVNPRALARALIKVASY